MDWSPCNCFLPPSIIFTMDPYVVNNLMMKYLCWYFKWNIEPLCGGKGRVDLWMSSSLYFLPSFQLCFSIRMLLCMQRRSFWRNNWDTWKHRTPPSTIRSWHYRSKMSSCKSTTLQCKHKQPDSRSENAICTSTQNLFGGLFYCEQKTSIACFTLGFNFAEYKNYRSTHKPQISESDINLFSWQLGSVWVPYSVWGFGTMNKLNRTVFKHWMKSKSAIT